MHEESPEDASADLLDVDPPAAFGGPCSRALRASLPLSFINCRHTPVVRTAGSC